MKFKTIVSSIGALGVLASSAAAVPASAQDQRSDRDRQNPQGYAQQGYNQDDNDNRRDHDRRDHRHDNRQDYRQNYRHNQQAQVCYYGGNYGYNGYNGNYRSGQRYPYYAQPRYVLNNYGAYGLAAPHRGYRYYRDGSGDIVLAAVATGIIALIIQGSAGNHGYSRY